MVAIERSASQTNPADARKSVAAARADIADSVKQYLSKEDKFATRLKASMTKSKASMGGRNEAIEEQT